MNEIKAIIQSHITSKVVRVLHELLHFPGLTIFDARGQGRGKGAGGAFKLVEDNIDYHKQTVIEIICADEFSASTVETIQRNAHTGNQEDGLINDLGRVIRIR